MKKMRQKKIVLILILVLMIGSLSMGFGLFSSFLNIKSSTTVSPSSQSLNLSVFDRYCSTVGGDSSCQIGYLVQSGNNIIIDGAKVNITKPGQSGKIYFSVKNEGPFDIYLNKGIVKNIDGTNLNKRCIAREGTTDALVQEACKKMNINLMWADSTNPNYMASTSINDNNNNAGTLLIKKQDYIKLGVSISYLDLETTLADGPFDIEIGDIEFTFSTAP